MTVFWFWIFWFCWIFKKKFVCLFFFFFLKTEIVLIVWVTGCLKRCSFDVTYGVSLTLTVRIDPVTLGQSSHQGCCQIFNKMSFIYIPSTSFSLCFECIKCVYLKRSIRTLAIIHILSIT